MSPRRNTQKKLFEVWCTASGERDYTHKQAAGQSCLSGQWTNWTICEHLRVMGLSDGSDPARMRVPSCLTSCNKLNHLWCECAGSAFSDAGESTAVRTQRSRAGERTVCPSERVKTCRGDKRKEKMQRKFLTTENNTGKFPLLCDEIVLILCTITTRNNCMKAWLYITVTCQKWIHWYSVHRDTLCLK